jgi:hypothetical protein
LEVIAVERLLYSLNAKIPKNKKRIATVLSLVQSG